MNYIYNFKKGTMHRSGADVEAKSGGGGGKAEIK